MLPVIGNILDGEKDCLCPEADAVGELSAHDNALSSDGREWFPLDAQAVVLLRKILTPTPRLNRIVCNTPGSARAADQG